MPEEYTAILIDLNGKKISEFVIENSNMSVDVNDLPESVYILQIYNKKGNMQTYKLIKN